MDGFFTTYCAYFFHLECMKTDFHLAHLLNITEKNFFIF